MADELQASPALPGKPRPAGKPGLRGGFYSRYMTALELGDLDAILQTDLGEVIAMLKVTTRRAFAEAQGEKDPDRLMGYLGALGLAAIRLASLERTNRVLYGKESSSAEIISQALGEVLKELKES